MSIKTLEQPIVKSIGGANIHVNSLAKMASWYSELLNMPIEKIENATPFYVLDMDNGVNLMLDDHRNMNNQTKHPICMLKTDNIERAYELVKKSGIPVVLDIQKPHPGLAYFNIEDSEGNVIMIQYSDWINPSPVVPMMSDHPIKNHLNCIVIPVENLKRATEWYSKLLGYPIKPERQDGGPIYWFEMDHGTGILLDDNRNNQDLCTFPTFMLKATNIHEAYDFVKQHDIEILREIQYDHYFMIKDIEGNTIMICL